MSSPAAFGGSLGTCVEALRQKVLDAAVRGELTEQRAEDGSAADLLKEIAAEKQELIKAGKLKKEKPLPEITEEEIPFEIPESWEWVRIGHILNLHAGKSKDTAAIQKTRYLGSYPCYGGNGLRGYVSDYNQEGEHCLIGRQGALCGNINYADGKFYATEHAVVVDTFCNCYTRLIGLFLEVINLNQYATSVAQPGLAVCNINTKLFPLPPLAEQRRIVEKVDSIFHQLDELKTLQTAYASNLEALRKKVIEEGVRGNLTERLPEDGSAADLLKEIAAERAALVAAGKMKKEKPLPEISEEEKPFEIPESWEWVRLGNIAQISSGGTPSRNVNSYWSNGTIPWIKISDIAGKYVTAAEEYITEEGLNNSSAKIFPSGTLLFSIFATLGDTGILKIDAATNQAIAGIKFYCDINIDFAYYLLSSLKSRVEKIGKGTTQMNINQSILKNLPVALPPLAEQKRIATKIEGLMKIIDGM